MHRLLVIDNYDSFTYNLVQAFELLGAEVYVYRNDCIDSDEALSLDPSHLLVSPGPGRPEDAGATMELIESFAGRIPILGVCLGHQALALHFGAKVTYASTVVHGKADWIEHDGVGLFRGLPCPLKVGRYHSLAVGSPTEGIQISARSADGGIMAFRHRRLAAFGIQFHPESILCPQGMKLMANFLHRL
jgi:anthranilate synthase/aminodeoxychorismate synthase-like glutamine amidotransferase